MENLVCEGFHHVLLKYGDENAEMQKPKFDDVTLQYSILHICTLQFNTLISRAHTGIFIGAQITSGIRPYSIIAC